MKIKINVKEDHIINGECSNVRGCAIALAVKDIMPEAAVIAVRNGYEIGIIDYSKYKDVVDIAKIPPFVGHKIALFDEFDENHIVRKARLEHLQPFAFVVDVDESKLFPDKLLQEIEQIIEGSNNIELVTV